MTFGLRVTHTISMGTIALIAGLSAFYLWRTAQPTRERQYTIGFTMLFLVAWGVRVNIVDSFLMKLANNQFCSKWIAYECSLFAVYLILLSISVSEIEKRKAERFFKYVIAVAVFIPLMMPSVSVVENPWAIRANFWRFFVTDLVVFSFYSWVLWNVLLLTISRLKMSGIKRTRKLRWLILNTCIVLALTYVVLRTVASLAIVSVGEGMLSEVAYNWMHLHIRFFLIASQLLWVVSILPQILFSGITHSFTVIDERRRIKHLHQIVDFMPAINMPMALVDQNDHRIRMLVMRIGDIRKLAPTYTLSVTQQYLLEQIDNVDDSQSYEGIVDQYVAIGRKLSKR